MGLLDNISNVSYYSSGNYGGYQFISLKDVIDQFMVVYVGEEKIINKARKLDVQFHAMRAMQELSFDTFKSVKTQEIELPSTLTMPLPIDYVNYVKLCWVDDAGIKHVIYPTKYTGNPQALLQNEDGSYFTNLTPDGNFETANPSSFTLDNVTISTASKSATFTHATGVTSSITIPNVLDPLKSYSISIELIDQTLGSVAGLSKLKLRDTSGNQLGDFEISSSSTPGYYNINFTTDANTTTDLVIVKPTASSGNIIIKNLVLVLDEVLFQVESDTFSRFKSLTARDNVNRYDDGTYDLIEGERYGIQPQFAQVNGSFFIDDIRGNIHFSSNIGGKTIILEYLSDGLGTDDEMKVHKLAEEAVYRYIAHAILAGKANVPEYIVNRFKKEKFAAIRQAKLRLSNIKLEEITQIFRDKSKWIKR